MKKKSQKRRRLPAGIKPANFLFLIAAGFINAFGIALFLYPWQLLDGGLSGTSYLLSQVSVLPLPVWLVILNFPFFLFAWKKTGFAVVLYSLVAIGSYSLATWLYQSVFGLCGADFMQSPFVTKEYDIILASVFGGLISGIGSGLTIRFGGAMDGVEVMGVLFARKIGLTVGQFVMLYNVVQYAAAGFIFKDFQIPLYSIIAYAIGLKAVDFIVDGLDKGKAAMIITDHPQELGKAVSRAMGRGITVLSARGFHSDADKGLLYCVVNRFEVGTLKKIISDADPAAFVSISEVSDMMGSDVSLRLRGKGKKQGLSEPDVTPNKSEET